MCLRSNRTLKCKQYDFKIIFSDKILMMKPFQGQEMVLAHPSLSQSLQQYQSEVTAKLK